MTMRRTRTGVWWVFAAALMLALASGACGGDGKKGDTTPEVDDDDDFVPADDDDDDDDDIMIPEEKFETIKNRFDRKRQVVSKCFVDAVEEGEIDKDAKVMITITLTIKKNGKAANVQTSETNTDSKLFEDCVHEKLTDWTVTTLPKDLEYSYTFAFDTL
jgi:hypothetical protein